MSHRDFLIMSFLASLAIGNVIPAEPYHGFWGMEDHDYVGEGFDGLVHSVKHALPIWLPLNAAKLLYDWYIK